MGSGSNLAKRKNNTIKGKSWDICISLKTDSENWDWCRHGKKSLSDSKSTLIIVAAVIKKKLLETIDSIQTNILKTDTVSLNILKHGYENV